MDPYSTEQYEGGTKPNRALIDDSEGATTVVGARGFLGGIKIHGGVQRTRLSYNPRSSVGVQRVPLTHDPSRPGASPTMLGYDPLIAVGTMTHSVDIHSEGATKSTPPWYQIQTQIEREGVGAKNYEKLTVLIQIHAIQGSFLPHRFASLLHRLAHYGDREALAALTYSQQTEAGVRAQMRQRGMA